MEPGHWGCFMDTFISWEGMVIVALSKFPTAALAVVNELLSVEECMRQLGPGSFVFHQVRRG